MTANYNIRTHRPGDMGLIIHQHATLYKQLVGWDPSFEADVARTTLDFLDNFDPNLERAFIVESVGTSEFLGSVAVLKHRKEASTAHLRFLLVDPAVRGVGLGSKLIDECVRFARECGYAKIVLWTYSALGGARRLYERAGFVVASTEEQECWGVRMNSETWELSLSDTDGQSTEGYRDS
ncbi:acyl-CoA N-acyltransferase [Xylaria bambusicola]|uniref:acyl-CoA N-acyltransferase n=1 Tax=Xylaria bambusicola TaxID=326684 RepID=UPI002007A027|nr:acyl-CoA N-acyltransferase [Xylaria bambusicola]KAI0505382.1 acyl-CoA N-acyltransferase [Xylaria bambusicola]